MNNWNDTDQPPWSYVPEQCGDDRFHGTIYGLGFKGAMIARCNLNGSYLKHAHLLAAAPELRAALEDLLEFWDDRGHGFQSSSEYQQIKAAARAALSKSTPEGDGR